MSKVEATADARGVTGIKSLCRRGDFLRPRSHSLGHGFEIIDEEAVDDQSPSEWVEFSKQTNMQTDLQVEAAIEQPRPVATQPDDQVEKLRRANARLELRVQVHIAQIIRKDISIRVLYLSGVGAGAYRQHTENHQPKPRQEHSLHFIDTCPTPVPDL
jgi:hypothetical protein